MNMKRKTKIVHLPSGLSVDLNETDISEIRHSADAQVLMVEFGKKVADIEGQIAAERARAHACETYPDGEWLGRANKALRYAKMGRQSCQQLFGELNKAEREAEHRARDQKFERAFINTARTMLPVPVYQAIVAAAQTEMRPAT